MAKALCDAELSVRMAATDALAATVPRGLEVWRGDDVNGAGVGEKKGSQHQPHFFPDFCSFFGGGIFGTEPCLKILGPPKIVRRSIEQKGHGQKWLQLRNSYGSLCRIGELVGCFRLVIFFFVRGLVGWLAG